MESKWKEIKPLDGAVVPPIDINVHDQPSLVESLMMGANEPRLANEIIDDTKDDASIINGFTQNVAESAEAPPTNFCSNCGKRK